MDLPQEHEFAEKSTYKETLRLQTSTHGMLLPINNPGKTSLVSRAEVLLDHFKKIWGTMPMWNILLGESSKEGGHHFGEFVIVIKRF